ncbi:MAG: Adenine-specific DNA methylase [Parcubacteria group bacterium GW2011_GWA2_44_12]|nr:MAG: Adenine-specific DNA methylase [Parcubacteria group bacterium GW2011_GWA2_44_12]
MILQGDCLKELKKIDDKSVDLVYLDPPFFTQKKHSLKSRDNSKEYSFEDTWENIESYKNYIQERLVECKRVLKDTGSVFLHCDRTASHYLRVTLDEVFGMPNFQSEIVWSYKRWSNAKKGLLNSHQIIYFYSKSPHFKFNKTFDAYSPTTNIDQIFQKRVRDENGKTKYKKAENGDYELMEQKSGVPLADVWEIPYLNPKANERVGYPTQKPVILLERIIQLVTDKGDAVLDPFCGSGTTLVAAALLNRKYIGIDISEDAIELTKKRLANPVKSDSLLLKNGKNSYLNQDKDILGILKTIEAEPVQRNKGIDGFLKIKNTMKPVPVRIQRKSETLENAKTLLLKASRKNRFKLAVLLKTNNTTDATLFNFPETENKNLFIVESVSMIPKLRNKLEMLV